MEDDMEDDLYFWSKAKNSMFDRYIVRNKCAHLGMAHLKTEGSIIKTIHVASEEGEWTEAEAIRFDDLTPYTVYSLNKRKRWETEDEIGVEILKRTNKFHEDTADVVILERVNLKTYEWKYLPWVRYPRDFLINSVHRLKKSENGESFYENSELNTIFGQAYSHFLEENRQPTKTKKPEIQAPKTQIPIVAYNFIRPPRNYMRLGEQNFVSSNYGPNFLPSCLAYNKRLHNLEDSKMQIRYRNFEDVDDSDEASSDDDSDSETTPKPSTHYNLANHIIPDNFVFVKRKKIKAPLPE